MNKILLFLVLISLSLLAVDTDFDGVEDEVDRCLETDILDVVTADGCSKKQKNLKKKEIKSKEKSYDISLFQTFSALEINDRSSIQNYGLSLMLSKESWLFYVGSGYFKYNNSAQDINDFSDTMFLAQKIFMLSSEHYLKSSISTTLPTYNSDGNKIDYGANISYLYLHKKFDFEVTYQYDLINDIDSSNLQTAYLYLGYALNDDFHATLGYSKDNEQRESKTLFLEYYNSDNLSFSYGFTKSKNNFYDTMHSLGVGYRF